jgi:hypothetical protein
VIRSEAANGRRSLSLESRIRRLEDREEIRDLAVRYGLAVDERDFSTIKTLFTPDGRLRTAAGVIKGQGANEVVAYFERHMNDLGPTNHFVHGHLVEHDPDDPNLAKGIVASHAEMWRNGLPMITAMRYLDTYRRFEGSWRFEERIQSYMYFVDVRDYPEALGSRLRMRAKMGKPEPADWPEIFT